MIHTCTLYSHTEIQTELRMWEVNVRTETVWHHRLWRFTETRGVSRTAFAAIWLVVMFWCKNLKCFVSTSLSLCLIEGTDVKEAVCPSYQQLCGPVSVTPSCPWAALSLTLSICFDSCSHILSHTLPPPFPPSHHSVSLSYSSSRVSFYTLKHVYKYTQTHGNRPGFVCVTWVELLHWAERASLSRWLAFAPRVD